MQISERFGSRGAEKCFVQSYSGGYEPVAEGKGHTTSVREQMKQLFACVFLPHGYPDSVSEDYLEYQIWDTLQAFCSSITGTLASHALLKGYGVGDEKATVMAATLTYLMKDGAGMVGRILFAWKKGIQLDCDAKRWRFMADILNDCAICLDLMAPLFQNYFLLVVCMSSLLKSVVGVAGGATRASLTLHQARRDNMADVSAKDGSQETLVNLLALLVGLIVIPVVSNNQALVWMFFILFTFLHLFANFRAVSCVVMETLNLPRFHIILLHYLHRGEVPSPVVVNKTDPVLRLPGYHCRIHIGAPIHKIAQQLPVPVSEQLDDYILHMTFDDDRNLASCDVILREHASLSVYHRAACHVMLMDVIFQNTHMSIWNFGRTDLAVLLTNLQTKVNAFKLQVNSSSEEADELRLLGYAVVEKLYPYFESCLASAGWDVKRSHVPVDEWRAIWVTNKQE